MAGSIAKINQGENFFSLFHDAFVTTTSPPWYIQYSIAMGPLTTEASGQGRHPGQGTWIITRYWAGRG